MQKIKIMTDSACDISPELEKELGIKIMCFPITVGDVGYRERISFSNNEFYEIMDSTPEFPLTAQITTFEFVDAYKELFEQGYTDIINVTISSSGSNTYNSALMAKDNFFEEYPQAIGKINIYIIDSLSYTAVYGYPITQAAIKANKGSSVEEILAYLEDWLSCGELHFASYTLEYVKKSGRLSAASAFVGELLGLRPLIKVVDGVSYVPKKVRGDKNIIPELVETCVTSMIPKTPYIILKGSIDEYPNELAKELTKRLGYPPVAFYQIGAAVSANAGHKVAGFVIKGKKRR